MTLRNKILLVVLCLIFFASMGIGVTAIYTPLGAVLLDMTPGKKREYQQIKQKMRMIKLGMTKKQVKEIMGNPESVIKIERYEIWYFPDYRDASEPSCCAFYIETGRVAYVVNDEYHLEHKESLF